MRSFQGPGARWVRLESRTRRAREATQPTPPTNTDLAPPPGGMGHTHEVHFKADRLHPLSHGGSLRQKRLGRKTRPLSCHEPLHLVFKVNRSRLRARTLRSKRGLPLLLAVIRQYSRRFGVKIEQCSIQNDHCHLLIRAPRRSRFHDFFRVVAGQIAQRFEKEGLLSDPRVTGTPSGGTKGRMAGTGLWMFRPFSRVVRGYRAYRTIREYIQLNELEVLGKIRYQKSRLRDLDPLFRLQLWKLSQQQTSAP